MSDVHYPTGVLEGLSRDELDEYYAYWDRLRAEAISESDRQEIDAIFGREVARSANRRRTSGGRVRALVHGGRGPHCCADGVGMLTVRCGKAPLCGRPYMCQILNLELSGVGSFVCERCRGGAGHGPEIKGASP